MSVYRCESCGFIYDDKKFFVSFNELREDYECPLCGVTKDCFEVADEFTLYEKNKVKKSKNNIYNAVAILSSNPCVERIDGCINCGQCMRTCLTRECLNDNDKCLKCIGCGQCILTCPKKVLQPKNDVYKFLNALDEGKTCIAYISPAVKVSIGEMFGYKPGTFLEDKLITALKEIGFSYVFDTSFGADLTIIEESNELLDRINNKGVLPMFSSCCPAWVSYVNENYPKLKKNLSSCKSPIGMQGTVIKSYFAKYKKINCKDIFTVAITPCTAKKSEIIDSDTDCVITCTELGNYLIHQNINLKKLKSSLYDDFVGSGNGLLFGESGGVAYSIINYINSLDDNIDDVSLNAYDGLKSYKFTLNNRVIRVAVISEISRVIPILDAIKNKKCNFDFIEVMNCRGGCIGGGGLPYYSVKDEEKVKLKRINGLTKASKNNLFKDPKHNIDAMNLYCDLFGSPGSKKAKDLLHKKDV